VFAASEGSYARFEHGVGEVRNGPCSLRCVQKARLQYMTLRMALRVLLSWMGRQYGLHFANWERK